MSNEDATFLEGKCLSYSRNISYHPVTDVLRANFDIQEVDDDPTITENVLAQFNLGETYVALGDYEKTKGHFEKAVSLAKHGKFFQSWVNWNRLGVAKARVMNNEKDIELNVLRSYAHENQTRMHDGIFSRYIADILFHMDDQHISEAEGWIKQAIESCKCNGQMFDLGSAYALYAELCEKRREKSKAKAQLDKAVEIFRECGADGWVEKYAGLRDSI